MNKIVTRGLGTGSLLVTRGYGIGSVVTKIREILRLTSKIGMALTLESKWKKKS